MFLLLKERTLLSKHVFHSFLKTINGVSRSQTSTHVFIINSSHEPWAEVQLFKRLPEDVLPSLAPACEVKDYMPGGPNRSIDSLIHALSIELVFFFNENILDCFQMTIYVS